MKFRCTEMEGEPSPIKLEASVDHLDERFFPSNDRPIHEDFIAAHMHRGARKLLVFLVSPRKVAILTRAHNPLVHGSSPCGPTTFESRATCAAFSWAIS